MSIEADSLILADEKCHDVFAWVFEWGFFHRQQAERPTGSDQLPNQEHLQPLSALLTNRPAIDWDVCRTR